jgi:MFS family permease
VNAPGASPRALVIAGFLGTRIGWRYSFGVLGVIAAGIFLFGKQLNPVESQSDLKIDMVGRALHGVPFAVVENLLPRVDGPRVGGDFSSRCAAVGSRSLGVDEP